MLHWVRDLPFARPYLWSQGLRPLALRITYVVLNLTGVYRRTVSFGKKLLWSRLVIKSDGRYVMASVDITSLNESEHRVQLRRAVIASTIGTAIEWYDFFLYSVVTGLVFAKLFFPTFPWR